MVIVRSYVSLPEGNQGNGWEKPRDDSKQVPFLGGGLYDICIIMIIILDEYTTQWL